MILDATIISLKVVTLSVIITLLISIVSILYIGDGKRKYRRILEFIIILPMFIPPSAIGYLILITLGRNGLIGKVLNEKLDISIIFTISAAVIASIVVTIPIMYQSIKTAVTSVDSDVKNAARVCGANELVVFIKITLPLSIKGICNGILLSFARAFGEFGATILVAGNIPGKTQTLPMALYYAMENNNSKEARDIILIVLIIAIILMNIYSYLSSNLDK